VRSITGFTAGIGLLVAAAVPALAQGSAGDEVDHYQRLHLFFETLERIQDYYVEDLSTEELVDLAIGGIVKGLDEHSRFLDPEDFDSMRSTTTGRFHGIGVVLAIRGEYPTVISAIDHTPAQRAGVRPGDQLIAIDGHATKGLALDEVVDLLRGEWHSEVAITLDRRGRKAPEVVRLQRDEIHVDSVVGPLFPEPGIAYIRLSRFTETTATEFGDALAEVREAAAAGLVLDLRGNPGGLLGQAVDVADRFVPMGDVIVEVRGRNPSESRTYRSTPTPKCRVPLVVLVDEGSASAAEIVAGAIQDHHLGTLIGRPTFGKGSVQSVFGLEAGNALKLTTAHYFTPSGRNVDRGTGEEGGIAPDLDVAAAEPDSVALEVVRLGYVTEFLSTSASGATLDLSLVGHADYIQRFRTFLASRGFAAARSANEAPLAQALAEEAALRQTGEAGALSVRLPRDPQFVAAVRRLEGRAQAAAHAVSP
jgi:carboxyl-terminal processing protease